MTEKDSSHKKESDKKHDLEHDKKSDHIEHKEHKSDDHKSKSEYKDSDHKEHKSDDHKSKSEYKDSDHKKKNESKSEHKAQKTNHEEHKSEHKKSKKEEKKKSSNGMTIIAVGIIIILTILILRMDRLNPTNPVDPSDPSVAAYVNGEEITVQELEDLYSTLPDSYQQFISHEDFLSQMISEELLLQKAAKAKITVSDEELDAFFDKTVESSGLSMQEVEARLADQNMTVEKVKSTYKRQMIVARFLNETIVVEVSDDDVKDFFDNNSDLYKAPEGQIRASHILVNSSDEAQAVIDRFNNGEDFADLAKELSIGPSSVNGGDLGYFGKGQMVAAFEDAAFDLDVGEISDPVETEFGWHVILRTPDVQSFDDVKDQIRSMLEAQKQQDAFDEYLVKIRNESDIVINYKDPAKSSNYSSCVVEQGLDPSTVVFYHASWCPHCKKMMPIVKSLEDEGLKFLWAETSSGDNLEVVKACLSDVIEGGVPEFICANSGEHLMGEVSKDDLRAFAEKCATTA